MAGGWRAHYFDLLARSQLQAGQPAAGARAAGHAQAVAEATGLRSAHGWAEGAAAAVANDSGDFATAAAHADESIAECEDSGMVIEAGMSRMIRGHALTKTGDTAGAATEFERAHAAFDRQKGDPLRLAAERELRRLCRPIL